MDKALMSPRCHQGRAPTSFARNQPKFRPSRTSSQLKASCSPGSSKPRWGTRGQRAAGQGATSAGHEGAVPGAAGHGHRELQPRGRREDGGGDPAVPRCPLPAPGRPVPPELEPRDPLESPQLPPRLRLRADPPSGTAGSVSCPHPHFPIQDIWVASTERRLICPLIPQPGAARGPEPRPGSGAGGWGGGSARLGGFPRICHHLITTGAPQQRSLCAPRLPPAGPPLPVTPHRPGTGQLLPPRPRRAPAPL